MYFWVNPIQKHPLLHFLTLKKKSCPYIFMQSGLQKILQRDELLPKTCKMVDRWFYLCIGQISECRSLQTCLQIDNDKKKERDNFFARVFSVRGVIRDEPGCRIAQRLCHQEAGLIRRRAGAPHHRSARTLSTSL